MTFTLILTQGKVAIVDIEDMPRVAGYKWSALRTKNGRWYAKARDGSRWIYLHRVIMGAPDELDVDHKDHDGLNNRRDNLRLATRTQNLGNQRRRRSKNKFKGYTAHPTPGRWIAQIRFKGKHVYIGAFSSEREAAEAYDRKALELYGEFAAINFPKGG